MSSGNLDVGPTEQTAMSTLPNVAKIDLLTPIDWLKGGWSDLWKIPAQGMIYGLGLTIISAAMAFGLFFTGHSTLIMVLAGGFVFVGPMIAMGLYEAGRQLETGQTPSLQSMLFVKTNSTRCLCYLGLALLMVFFLWTELGQIVYGISSSRFHASPREFMEFLLYDDRSRGMAVVGTIIGGVMAFLAYTLVVVTAPMLLERHTNVFMAVATSFRSVTGNFLPMLFWAAIIAALTGIGILTGFLGLIIIFPWLGLASWRAYRGLVDSPDHPGFQPR